MPHMNAVITTIFGGCLDHSFDPLHMAALQKRGLLPDIHRERTLNLSFVSTP